MQLFSACCSPAAEGSVSNFRLPGKQGGRGYNTTHVRIPSEHSDGARGSERRLAGSKKQGIVFRLVLVYLKQLAACFTV